MSEQDDGFTTWAVSPDGQGIDITAVGNDGVFVLPLRSGGERPEDDQGLLLDDGSLYGPGTQRQVAAAAQALDPAVDWQTGYFRELRKRADRLVGPLPAVDPSA